MLRGRQARPRAPSEVRGGAGSSQRRGARNVSFRRVVLAEPFASWATAVAVTASFFFLRSRLKVFFESLTASLCVEPGAKEKETLEPASVRDPRTSPPCPRDSRPPPSP